MATQRTATFSNIPPLYNNRIFCQTRIGWKQLFLSRFVLKWSDLQQDHLVLQNITSKKYSGTSWSSGITQIIWHHVYSNWEARNADLHGIDATMREQAQYAQAQRETEEITPNDLWSSPATAMYSTAVLMNISKKSLQHVG